MKDRALDFEGRILVAQSRYIIGREKREKVARPPSGHSVKKRKKRERPRGAQNCCHGKRSQMRSDNSPNGLSAAAVGRDDGCINPGKCPDKGKHMLVTQKQRRSKSRKWYKPAYC